MHAHICTNLGHLVRSSLQGSPHHSHGEQCTAHTKPQLARRNRICTCASAAAFAAASRSRSAAARSCSCRDHRITVTVSNAHTAYTQAKPKLARTDLVRCRLVRSSLQGSPRTTVTASNAHTQRTQKPRQSLRARTLSAAALSAAACRDHRVMVTVSNAHTAHTQAKPKLARTDLVRCRHVRSIRQAQGAPHHITVINAHTAAAAAAAMFAPRRDFCTAHEFGHEPRHTQTHARTHTHIHTHAQTNTHTHAHRHRHSYTRAQRTQPEPLVAVPQEHDELRDHVVLQHEILHAVAARVGGARALEVRKRARGHATRPPPPCLPSHRQTRTPCNRVGSRWRRPRPSGGAVPGQEDPRPSPSRPDFGPLSLS